MPTANAINDNSTGLSNYNGTGTFTGVTVTNHSVLIGGASNAITSLALTNGQLAIGSTGADPAAATLSAGVGIAITNGAGTISIAASGGGLTWAVTTVDASIVAGNGYIANKGTVLTMTLPASSAIGDMFTITGINTALGWKIGQNANQQIFFGTSSTTVGVGGSLASAATRDTVTAVCVVAGASAAWNIVSSIGNITVV